MEDVERSRGLSESSLIFFSFFSNIFLVGGSSGDYDERPTEYPGRDGLTA